MMGKPLSVMCPPPSEQFGSPCVSPYTGPMPRRCGTLRPGSSPSSSMGSPSNCRLTYSSNSMTRLQFVPVMPLITDHHHRAPARLTHLLDIHADLVDLRRTVQQQAVTTVVAVAVLSGLLGLQAHHVTRHTVARRPL